MKIQFIGSGSAFSMKNYQTNIIVEENDKRFLIDAGGDIRFALRDANLSYKDINAVYVSHLHTDHAGGIEFFGLCTYFDPTFKDKIQLFGNNELLRRGWQDTWKGGLESYQGKILSLGDYFDVTSVPANGRFLWEDIEFRIVQTVHIMNGYSIVPSYGLMLKDPTTQKIIYFTTDTQFVPSAIMDFYKQADFIVQDCETTPYKSGVHANYSDLTTLPPNVKEKMMLVHYQDNVLEKAKDGINWIISPEWKEKAAANGFYGFANKNSVIDINKFFMAESEISQGCQVLNP